MSSVSKVNLLLPAAVFFDVIKKLVHSNNSTVRRKAMELLNSKLSNSADSYPSDQVSVKVLSIVLDHKCSFNRLVCTAVIFAG